MKPVTVLTWFLTESEHNRMRFQVTSADSVAWNARKVDSRSFAPSSERENSPSIKSAVSEERTLCCIH